jgi:hypothetical protein
MNDAECGSAHDHKHTITGMDIASTLRPRIVKAIYHFIAQEFPYAPMSQLVEEIGNVGRRDKQQEESQVSLFVSICRH